MRDLRFAVRLLLTAPVFATTAVLTLALCIGANTAIYTVVDRVLLRALPYPRPERLAEVITRSRAATSGTDSPAASGRCCSAASRRSTWRRRRADLDRRREHGGPRSRRVREAAARVGGIFRVLGVPPAVGREFTADEDRPNGPAAVILSHQLWTRLFNGDAERSGARSRYAASRTPSSA